MSVEGIEIEYTDSRRYDTIDMKWKGRHTVGETGPRGTRCWFNPDSGLILTPRIFDNDTFDCRINPESGLFVIPNHLGPGMLGDIFAREGFDAGWSMFGDGINIRNEYLGNIIDELRCQGSWVRKIENYKDIYEEYHIWEYGINRTNFDKFINKDKVTCLEETGCGYFKIYVIYKLDEILDELEYVYQKAIENGVTFEWI